MSETQETMMSRAVISEPVHPAGSGDASVAASRERASRRQIAIALIFTAAILMATVLCYATSFDEAKRMDFATRYAAGLMVRQGNGSKLYDIDAQTRVQRDLFGRETPLLELHPPFEALLYAPLAKLPYLWAYVLWGMVNIGLWMASVYFLRKSVPVPKQTFRFLAVCFTFFPLWLTLHGGQTSILLLLSYSLTLFGLK